MKLKSKNANGSSSQTRHHARVSAVHTTDKNVIVLTYNQNKGEHDTYERNLFF